ncbi:MAG: hypothetical protein ACI9QC_000650 [Oceanicoccus sp.]|jgi:hypothetical protein
MAKLDQAFDAYMEHDPETTEGEITMPFPDTRRQALAIMKKAFGVFKENFEEDSKGAGTLNDEALTQRRQGNQRLADVLRSESDALADGNRKALRALLMARPALKVLTTAEGVRSSFMTWMKRAALVASVVAFDGGVERATDQTIAEHTVDFAQWAMSDDGESETASTE